MSNRKLKELIKSVKEKSEAAQNNQELLNAVSELINYGKPIKFNYRSHIIISFIGFLVFSIYLSAMFFDVFSEILIFDDVIYEFVFLLVFLTIGITPLCLMAQGHFSVTNLSDYIFDKDKLQDNNFVELNKDDNYFHILKSHFPSNFSKGNYSRKFKRGYKTDFGNFYHFEYVDSRTIMVPVTTVSS